MRVDVLIISTILVIVTLARSISFVYSLLLGWAEALKSCWELGAFSCFQHSTNMAQRSKPRRPIPSKKMEAFRPLATISTLFERSLLPTFVQCDPKPLVLWSLMRLLNLKMPPTYPRGCENLCQKLPRICIRDGRHGRFGHTRPHHILAQNSSPESPLWCQPSLRLQPNATRYLLKLFPPFS